MMRNTYWFLVVALMLIPAAMSRGADAPAAGRAPKTIRLLGIRNSFLENATEYLPDIVKSQGDTLVIERATIGGGTLQQHWEVVQKNEANPDDAAGKPYYLTGKDGLLHKGNSLKQALQFQQWDIV